MAVAPSGTSVAGERADAAERCDPANHVVSGVGDVEGPVAIDGDSGWRAQPRHFGDAVGPSLFTPGNGRHDPIRRDPANTFVSAVGDVGGVVWTDATAKGSENCACSLSPSADPSIPDPARIAAAGIQLRAAAFCPTSGGARSTRRSGAR